MVLGFGVGAGIATMLIQIGTTQWPLIGLLMEMNRLIDIVN